MDHIIRAERNQEIISIAEKWLVYAKEQNMPTVKFVRLLWLAEGEPFTREQIADLLEFAFGMDTTKTSVMATIRWLENVQSMGLSGRSSIPGN